MADDEAKAQSIGISNKEEDFKNPNPFVSIFQNLLHIFPPLKPKTNHASPPSPQQVSAEETETYKPEVVTFPDTRQTIPPLKLEAEELEKNSNPAILWQVDLLSRRLAPCLVSVFNLMSCVWVQIKRIDTR